MERLIEDLSFYTGIDSDFIRKCLIGNDNYFDYYKKIEIEKKTGGYRIIYAPCPELKLIQHLILEKYFKELPVSEYAFAYRPNISVLDNAMKHSNNKHFLFIDLHDFFNSINFDIIKSQIINCEKMFAYTEDDIDILLRLCSHNKKFVQGCVTSPMLSNFYLFDFDIKMHDIVSKLKNGVYTRYSDDITISSSESIPISLLNEIKNILYPLNLSINEKKTHFSSYLEKVKITGLRIKNDGNVSLNTKYKKKIKTSVYHIFNNTNPNIKEIKRVLGCMNYLKMVDAKYYDKINTKYSLKNVTAVDRLVKLIVKKQAEGNTDYNKFNT